ncbi:hypothetical protein MMC18_001050 [Xylographa bjoerkii]|nr:hypothetical protein [Xylographa bjoerkii]
MASRPSFADLPLRAGDPPYSAWGLWGLDDELGTLSETLKNLLTDDVVATAAREEIKTGVRISLDWPLDKLQPPGFGRQAFHQQLIAKPPRTVNDDVITINTQSSSQWDGLRHFAYQREKLFYGGRSMEDFHSPRATKVNGIQAMANRGIIGRGVLIDHVSYCLKHKKSFSFQSGRSIPLSEVQAAATSQNLSFRPGDILFIRSGFTAMYEAASPEERVELAQPNPPTYSGVETGEKFARWIWEMQFAAVAGDAPSFEAWPPKISPSLHEILLSGWGCPIGELFDLEALAAHCQATSRWSFFLASVPLKNPGGAASPPNAIAIL